MTKERKKMKLKWQIKLLIIVLILFISIYFVGTMGIFIKEYKIETSKIDKGMHGLKILQFTDIHYGSVNKSKINDLVKKINSAKPDIVIFTGDLIDEKYKISSEEKEWMIKKLTEIKSSLGKYYVAGEEDKNTAISILNLSGFSNLKNQKQLIYNNSKKPIFLFDKNTIKLQNDDEIEMDAFKIVALHDPNDIENIKNYKFDLAISGHTHNGQINIPKIKNLFINGKYYKSYQVVNGSKLYINPGIGTSKFNIRLFNHPTIYLFRILKTSSS